jgi:hypothetical protein
MTAVLPLSPITDALNRLAGCRHGIPDSDLDALIAAAQQLKTVAS